MLNLIWLALLLTGVLVAIFTGKLDAVGQGGLNAAKSAVMDLAFPLVGVMALWLGLMRLAEKSGLIQRLGRLIRPVMLRLFPDVPSEHPAIGAMMMNISANMLGVSNAATPLGLKAMTELNRLNSKPGVATNAMCTFLAINTASIQLIPATAINLLAINGSKNPSAIVGSTLLSTGFATICAIITVKLLHELSRSGAGNPCAEQRSGHVHPDLPQVDRDHRRTDAPRGVEAGARVGCAPPHQQGHHQPHCRRGPRRQPPVRDEEQDGCEKHSGHQRLDPAPGEQRGPHPDVGRAVAEARRRVPPERAARRR